jgi:3-hydroxyisobutyrate dehydrogenase-like beta-hydroxyacid dehydrogenase
MRTGIIGTGAMGSRMGARVQQEGDSIVAYDRDGDRLAASG